MFMKYLLHVMGYNLLEQDRNGLLKMKNNIQLTRTK